MPITRKDNDPESKNISTSNRRSKKLRASRSGDTDVTEEWVFLDPEKEDALINRVRNRGQYRIHWVRTGTGGRSRLEGCDAPAEVVNEERKLLILERAQYIKKGQHKVDNLTVYEIGEWSTDGVDHPKFGQIPVPKGWNLLESGDPLITRRVKARGQWWEYYHRLKTKSYDQKLGVFAPASIIEEQRRNIAEERNTKGYEQRLKASRRSKAKRENKYTEELEQECYM